jgi:8-oxo-dGTP pyrophosphatase MutT (NUDIX family)
MEPYNGTLVLRTLRDRLLPVESGGESFDILEGQHPGVRKAAVLLALFEDNAHLSLAFIRRASTLRAHSGEIAFPGGSVDASDLSPVMTALREAEEEIGLDRARVAVLGLLPTVFTVVSNFLITPVVGFLPHGLGTLHLQSSEVAELILAPLRSLVDPAIAHTEEWMRSGSARTVHFYDYGPYRIWGATGRILHTLLQTLEPPPLDELAH